jgi:hypothetical protein
MTSDTKAVLSATETQAAAPPISVWERPSALGYQESLRGLGGIVAPLLAGFSLTAISVIVTANDVPRFAYWAVAAFSGCVALLLFSMQTAVSALNQNATPADILMWHPEATVSEAAFQEVRKMQAADFREMKRRGKRSFQAYGWGIVTFLLGVAFLLVPHAWTASRIVGLVPIGAALLLEVYWLAANRWGSLPHPVEHLIEPSHEAEWHGMPPALDAVAISSVVQKPTG